MAQTAALTNPELIELKNELLAIRYDSSLLLSELDNDTLNRRPAPGIWSIGQQLDHLNKADGMLLPGLSAAIADLAKQNRRAPGPFRYSFLERALLSGMNPKGWMRFVPIPVPPIYEPSTEPLTVEAISIRADELRQAYLELIAEADGLELTGGKVPSPANSKIAICPGAWLACVVAHDRYHVNKALAIGAAKTA